MNSKIIEKVLEKYLLGSMEESVSECMEETGSKKHPYIGKYVIVRGYDAGVWAGVLRDDTPGAMILEDARMLRYWRASEGTGLSGVASKGLREDKKDEIKINATQKQVMITDQRVSTIFLVSEKVEKQIRGREIR